MEYMVWEMREAHFPHHLLHLWRGEAARAPGRASEDAENQTHSELLRLIVMEWSCWDIWDMYFGVAKV